MDLPPLHLDYDPHTGVVEGWPQVERRLSQLDQCFADQNAYQLALARSDEVIYRVANVEVAQGDGQLHYSLAILMPGRIGAEYYLTRGHIHAWRPAAEVYIGLRGRGLMLFEAEADGACTSVPVVENSVIYVPGHAAHRTVNVGDEPLVYWGILSAAAGHDYQTVAQRGFRQVVAQVNGQPAVLDRDAFLRTMD